MLDVWAGAILLSLIVILILAYTARMILFGRVPFTRLSHEDGTMPFKKTVFEAINWVFTPFIYFLVRHKIKPNTLSFSSLLFGIIAAILLSLGYFGFANIFLFFSVLVDYLDGTVARLSNQVSDAGKVIDSILDRYIEFFIFIGLMIYYHDRLWLLLIISFVLIGSFIISYATAKSEVMKVALPPSMMRRAERFCLLFIAIEFTCFSSAYWQSSAGHFIESNFLMILILIVMGLMTNFIAIKKFRYLIQSVSKK